MDAITAQIVTHLFVSTATLLLCSGQCIGIGHYTPRIAYIDGFNQLTLLSRKIYLLTDIQCLYEHHVFIWTDDQDISMKIAEEGLCRTANLVTRDPSVFKIYNNTIGRSWFSEQQVLLKNLPPSVKIGTIGVEDSRYMLRGFWKLNLFSNQTLTAFWNVYLFHEKICHCPVSHATGLMEPTLFYEGWSVMGYPTLETKELNVYDFVTLNNNPFDLYTSHEVNLLDLILYVIGNCPSIPKHTMLKCECFHRGQQIDITNSTKYSINFTYDYTSETNVSLGFSLIIENFTLQDQGKYECNASFESSSGDPLHIRTKVVTLVPSFDDGKSIMNITEFMSTRNRNGNEYAKLSRTYDSTFTQIASDYNILRISLRLLDVTKTNVYTTWIILAWIILEVLMKIIFAFLQNLERRNYNHQLKLLMKMNKVKRNRDTIGTTCQYDIFLSHDPDDSVFVQDVLLHSLENLGYRVCYQPRDFDINHSTILDTGWAIDNSRKVICVFSPAYYRNAWCTEMEFAALLTGILNKELQPDRLIIIKYKACKMPGILERYPCLEWPSTQKRLVRYLHVIIAYLRHTSITLFNTCLCRVIHRILLYFYVKVAGLSVGIVFRTNLFGRFIYQITIICGNKIWHVTAYVKKICYIFYNSIWDDSNVVVQTLHYSLSAIREFIIRGAASTLEYVTPIRFKEYISWLGLYFKIALSNTRYLIFDRLWHFYHEHIVHEFHHVSLCIYSYMHMCISYCFFRPFEYSTIFVLSSMKSTRKYLKCIFETLKKTGIGRLASYAFEPEENITSESRKGFVDRLVCCVGPPA